MTALYKCPGCDSYRSDPGPYSVCAECAIMLLAEGYKLQSALLPRVEAMQGVADEPTVTMTANEFERWMKTGDPGHETECTCDACLCYEGQQIGERYGFALAMALVQMAEWASRCEREREPSRRKHIHDFICQWCGVDIWETTEEHVFRFIPHDCPSRPMQSAQEGAAVAFGLMGMAEAIRERERRRPREVEGAAYERAMERLMDFARTKRASRP